MPKSWIILTVESEADEAVLIYVHKKKNPKTPL
jgi:hypothetical protein